MAEQGLSTHGRNQGLGAQDEKDGAPSSQSSAPAQQNGDAAKHAEDQEKNDPAQAKKKASDKEQKSGDDKEPAGGFDATPFPPSRDGFTIRFTFHRAENLPISDLNSRSTDAYVHATLTCPLPKRHKEDPDITWRTPTIHKNVNPEWNSSWTVSGVPSSGFKLKCRLYDEDEADHDDRLGNVSLVVNQVGVSWSGVKEQRFQIKKKTGSKRAYGIRACGAMFSKNIHMNGHLYLSAEVLGESEKPYGRMYTIAETAWTKHYSPMIGRIAGTKAPGSEVKGSQDIEKYDFQANQFQLRGPVPAELYHRFVEFKPFVRGMFSSTGLRGRVLNKALHHQHARVYNYSNSTEYGIVAPNSAEAASRFLSMVHYDEGGRIFTYVLTLDGLFRFTETGKEFGIDLLSKHTMHSDVNIYIACSGEFFVRRLKDPKKDPEAPGQQTHPADDLPSGPPNATPPKDPSYYELVIDNDSGTYRPKGSLLPLLKEFLSKNFPGIHIRTKECTDKSLEKMKAQQRERKKKEGQNVEMVQNSDSEMSSSDEEELADHQKKIRKTTRQHVFEAVEDPSKAFKENLMPGGKGREEREERETEGDAVERHADDAAL